MNLKSKAIIATSTVMALGAFAAVPAFAVEGTTPVTYDSRNIIVGVENEWGVIIPTAITFQELNDEKAADVTLVDLTGVTTEFGLFDEDFEVDVKIASANGFQLKATGISAEGTYSMDKVTDITLKPTDAGKTHAGKATLNVAPTVEGVYTDTLTYTFTPNGDALK